MIVTVRRVQLTFFFAVKPTANKTCTERKVYKRSCSSMFSTYSRRARYNVVVVFCSNIENRKPKPDETATLRSTDRPADRLIRPCFNCDSND